MANNGDGLKIIVPGSHYLPPPPPGAKNAREVLVIRSLEHQLAEQQRVSIVLLKQRDEARGVVDAATRRIEGYRRLLALVAVRAGGEVAFPVAELEGLVSGTRVVIDGDNTRVIVRIETNVVDPSADAPLPNEAVAHVPPPAV